MSVSHVVSTPPVTLPFASNVDPTENPFGSRHAGLKVPSSPFFGAEAATHHAAIAKRFEAAWPSRGLPYLVQYGVYGLVGAIASE